MNTPTVLQNVLDAANKAYNDADEAWDAADDACLEADEALKAAYKTMAFTRKVRDDVWKVIQEIGGQG